MKRNNLIVIGVLALLGIIALCCIALVIVGSAFTIYNSQTQGKINEPTPVVIRPTSPAQPPSQNPERPTEKPNEPSGSNPHPNPANNQPVSVIPTDTLQTLIDTIVPINNLPVLAQRLEGKQNIPETLAPPAAPYQVGEQKSFWVTNVDSNSTHEIDATLEYVTENVYFWIQDGVQFNHNDLRDLVETFQDEIYPTNQEFFGSEWTPGVDGDPHLYILYAKDLGFSLAGYYSSADEYHPLAHEYSNAHEMFFLSADNVSLDEEFAYSVLAHEFQHMIHWYQDRNEETWLNEGFSELAAYLNGYSVGGSDYVYTLDPDMQLTDWPGGIEDTTPHYGAAFLYVLYFLDRFGEEATQAVVANPANGLVSVDRVLNDNSASDPLNGKIIQADDVFVDWTIASYLQDPQAMDGRYTYHNYPQAPQPTATESIRDCSDLSETRQVSQYGVDYIRLRCQGTFTLDFEGSIQAMVVPADPFSGEYYMWSNRGDESDMTLTRSFDFTAHSGPITLSYWTWYDLETDYDYLYLLASTDGENWQIITTPSGTPDDPSGNSYGWAYTGQSGAGPEWIQESVDISQFAGQQVHLRFEYVTDAAVHAEGFLLDDIAIPETDYFTDFETDTGGWVGDGFVRINNLIPQTYQVSLIKLGDETTVEKYALSGENRLSLTLEIGQGVDEVVLVVSGTARFTRQPAAYRFKLAR